MKEINFDKKLAELNFELEKIQKEIKNVTELRQKLDTEKESRKAFLQDNSICLKDLKLDVVDNVFYLSGVDSDQYHYIIRFNKDEAAIIADDLDAELTKSLQKDKLSKILSNDIFNQAFFNIK